MTMTKQDIQNIVADLRHITLFPRKYAVPVKKDRDYWGGIVKEYKNAEKMLDSSDFRWMVLEFADGHKELAYLRVLQGGFFSGHASAIYRGLIIPRRIDYVTFSHIDRIRLAF